MLCRWLGFRWFGAVLFTRLNGFDNSMRLIFVILIVLNALYAVYELFLVSDTPRQAVVTRVNSIKPFKLFDELNSDERTAFDVLLNPEHDPVQESVVSVPDVTESRQQCWQIGPIKDIFTKNQVQNRLQSHAIDIEFKQVERSEGLDYWVYLGPFLSQKAALRELRHLQFNKIDSFWISKGELRNAVSLGIFKSQQRAIALQQRYIAKGYDVQIKAIAQTVREYWAILKADDGLEERQGFKAFEKDFSSLETTKLLCKRLAKPIQFH